MSLLSERLRSLRGYSTQGEMAKAVGIRYQCWARYENGETVPGADILERICRVHCVSADWLLGIEKKNAASVVANHSAVVIGSGTAKIEKPGEAGMCEKCPHRRRLKKLEKALAG